MASRTKKPVKTTAKAKTKAKKPTVARGPRKAPAKPAKATAKKTQAKKTTVKKPQVKARKKAAVKSKIKPTIKAKARPKTAAKAPTTPVKPAATRKRAPAKAVAPRKPTSQVKAKPASRETLTTLRAHVDAIETRLKRANSLTKSSVKAMQTAFTKLNERSGQASAAQEKEIVEYVEALNVHLTGLIDKTREDVAHDLQVVLEDPRVETISGALSTANQRITRAESEQAAALTSINEQIANLATVVDRRLRTETEERERAQHILKAKIETVANKVETVEKSSADAVSGIGEKIVALTEELTNRTDHSIAAFKRELSETDTGHHQEIEDHKSEMGRRMEALEDDQRNSIPSIERRLVTIVSRLEALETERFNAIAPPDIAPAFEPAPQFDASSVEAAPVMATDAFSPQAATAYEAVTPPAQIMQLQSPQPMAMAPVEAPEPVLELSKEPTESHIPQEYVPQEYVAPTQPAHEYAAPDFPVQSDEHEYAAQPYASPEVSAMPEAFAGGYDQAQPAIMADMTTSPGVLPPPPFGTDIPLMPPLEQTMDEARPGGDILPQKSGGFLQKLKGGSSSNALSGSPIKLFALMTGIAVLGLFAAQKIMPGPKATNPQAQAPNVATTAPVTSELNDDPAFASNEPTPPVIESMDVVGDYSESMQAPDLEPDANGAPGEARLTLESAASNGDMIAQFQLGLSHLEAGRNAEAVRLIRLSANQGQPAAQYRLAKLYENGIGVEKDMPGAMKLLERSAKGGNRIAMHDLGHYYATGAASSEPEIAKAVTWFQQAAERGVLDSQFNLGVLYQEGSGVVKNTVDSYVWYAIAGAQGDPMAIQRAEILEREMSEAQVAQAKSRVKAFVPARIDDAANGVFGDLPWARPTQARSARVNTNVKQAQELLSDLGYEVGTPDGAMGPKTRNAIIRFEKSNGLPETGRVSAELMDRLSLAAGV